MNILKNRFVSALLILMLLSAAIHLVLLAIYAITNRNLESVNLFGIIGIDLNFPKVTNGAISQWLSLAVIVAAYLIIYFFFTKKKEQKLK
jgi:hypothetical protein